LTMPRKMIRDQGFDVQPDFGPLKHTMRGSPATDIGDWLGTVGRPAIHGPAQRQSVPTDKQTPLPARAEPEVIHHQPGSTVRKTGCNLPDFRRPLVIWSATSPAYSRAVQASLLCLTFGERKWTVEDAQGVAEGSRFRLAPDGQVRDGTGAHRGTLAVAVCAAKVARIYLFLLTPYRCLGYCQFSVYFCCC